LTNVLGPNTSYPGGLVSTSPCLTRLGGAFTYYHYSSIDFSDFGESVLTRSGVFQTARPDSSKSEKLTDEYG
jgi:hypothetical protein